MIKKLIKDIIKGEGDFNKGEDISPKSEGIPQKARVSPIPLLPRKEGNGRYYRLVKQPLISL